MALYLYLSNFPSDLDGKLNYLRYMYFEQCLNDLNNADLFLRTVEKTDKCVHKFYNICFTIVEKYNFYVNIDFANYNASYSTFISINKNIQEA